jgi:hypothetical protein
MDMVRQLTGGAQLDLVTKGFLLHCFYALLLWLYGRRDGIGINLTFLSYAGWDELQFENP